jgi:ubiquitin C-terminal hydrolase
MRAHQNQEKYRVPTAEELSLGINDLKGGFKKNNVRYVDFTLFDRAITNQFGGIPSVLVECLYQGFVSDTSTKITLTGFIETLEGIYGGDRTELLKFIFNVYDVRSVNAIERTNVERILRAAHGGGDEEEEDSGEETTDGNGEALGRYVRNAKPILDAMFSVKSEVAHRGSGDSSRIKNNFIERQAKAQEGQPRGESEEGDKNKSGVAVASVTAITNKRRSKIKFVDFLQFDGDITVISDWVLTAMKVFITTPSPRLMRNEKRYSAAVETEEMIARYGESQASIDKLRQIFYARCGSTKAELSLDLWVDWVVSYMTVDLAAALFRSKSRNFKLTWRFADFAEFCMIFGAGSLEDKALALCKMFYSSFVAEQQQQAIDAEIEAESKGETTRELRFDEAEEEQNEEEENEVGGEGDCGEQQQHSEGRRSKANAKRKEKLTAFLRSMRAMVLLLARSYDPEQVQPEPPKYFSANTSSLSEHVPNPSSRRRSLSESTSSEVGGNHSSKKPSLGVADKKDAEKYVSTLESLEATTFLPAAVRESLGEVEQEGREQDIEPPILLQRYIDLIINNESNLPGLRELSMTSCCLFGVRPPAPHLEKEYMMEIMMRRQAEFPQTSVNPFGPEDTEWCIISKSWWDSWRFYVGKIRQPSMHGSNKSNSGDSSPERVVPEPKAIDNWAILKRTGAKQLLNGISMGQHLEVIPPAVYASVYAWYGGGPRIIRKVVPVIKVLATTNSDGSDESSPRSDNGRPQVATELELFPLNLRVCSCDYRGKKRNDHKDYLFSKTATVAEMTQELCEARKLEAGKTRLWNYARPNWKDQYILSPELTLIDANLADEQEILMEISSSDGSWPRSQLHSDLAEEEAEAAGEDDEDGYKISSASGKHQLRINSGKVGLDNLGNTCYMNSSLQALMHTDPLVSYFLKNCHKTHVNVANRDGHGGRLAYYFGKLSTEMWGTGKSAISPRQFCIEVGYLNQQFQGNQQQDAVELIDFMLDGLSEDLNLVEKKPYTEQPDSDGRPDRELANIWWENHRKRQRSVVQSLFAGQFKSTRRCACGYSSARYEPFTLLTLPIPEDTQRVITAHVFTRGVSYGTKLSVVVDRDGTLVDVVNAFTSPTFMPALSGVTVHLDGSPALFAAAEVSSSRVKGTCKLTRRLRTIRDSDNIFFFEVVKESTLDREVRLRAELKKKQRELERESISSVDSSANANAAALDASLVDPSAPRDVKVCFVQRKARLGDGGGAMEAFYMTVFGLPQLEVIGERVTGASLYKLIGERVSAYLGGRPGLVRRLAMTYGADFEDSFGKASTAYFMGPVRSMGIEDAVGGPIPPQGFVLRLIEGGESSGCVCSECNWLEHCSGCFVPMDDTPLVLKDGQTVSIDWHMIVFEEMVDTAAIMKIHTHESASDVDSTRLMPGLPFSRCLEKFAETETLEGCVCPKCLEDDKMIRHDDLWRLPPVLVVQLKRFQWSQSDRSSRRKLTNKIDFPTEDLDLVDYIAPSRFNPDYVSPSKVPSTHPHVAQKEEGKGMQKVTAEEADEDGKVDGLPLSFEQPNQADSEFGCTVYDLYAAVHHVGAMGGGHYVCTVREGSRPNPQSPRASSTGTTGDSGGGAGSTVQPSTSSDSLVSENSSSETEQPLSDRWNVFNDGQVSSLGDKREVSAASAYVLFYMRRDARNMSIEELFPQCESDDVDRSEDFVFKERPSTRRYLQEHASKAASSFGGSLFGGKGNNKVREDDDEDSGAQGNSRGGKGDGCAIA